MIEHGRDIFPGSKTLEEYSDLTPLLTNTIIDDEYVQRDAVAVKAKRQFHQLGQLAILLIAGSAIFTLADALIPTFVPDSFILRLIAVSAAGVGVVLQLYLISTGQKHKWLLNRYATERLRSIKFQAYQCCYTAASPDDLKDQVDSFIRRSIADLDNELNGGISILRNFDATEAYKAVETIGPPANPALAQLGLDAFKELRVKYQLVFANSEVERFNTRRRVFNSTQDIVYLIAAVLTFLALGAGLYEPLRALMPIGWIEFLVVSCFVAGATEAILDNALLEEQSQSRYEQYARHISAVLLRARDPGASLGHVVAEMEALCLNELAQFCAAAQKISYRF